MAEVLVVVVPIAIVSLLGINTAVNISHSTGYGSLRRWYYSKRFYGHKIMKNKNEIKYRRIVEDLHDYSINLDQREEITLSLDWDAKGEIKAKTFIIPMYDTRIKIKMKVPVITRDGKCEQKIIKAYIFRINEFGEEGFIIHGYNIVQLNTFVRYYSQRAGISPEEIERIYGPEVPIPKPYKDQ